MNKNLITRLCIAATLVILLSPIVLPYLKSWSVINTYAETNSYRFPADAKRVDITLAPGEYRWVTIPAGLHVREDATNGSVRICFLDYRCIDDGPNIVNLQPVELAGSTRQGVFVICNLSPNPTTVTLVQLDL